MSVPSPSPRWGRGVFRRGTARGGLIGSGRSAFVLSAVLVLAGAVPCTSFAWHLAGKPDRADASRSERGEGTTELWEAADAEEPLTGGGPFFATPAAPAFAPADADLTPTAPTPAAVTRWCEPRLPRPPPAR